MSELRVYSCAPNVIDSSVAAKWFLTHESGSAAAAELLEGHRAGSLALIAPALLPLEVVNALLRRGAGLDDLQAAATSLESADLLLAPLDAWLLQEATRVASEDSVALYDALFIALAESLDAPLITADRRQGATRRCPVRIIG
jgi:predicted nucleic acid-binding protein